MEKEIKKKCKHEWGEIANTSMRCKKCGMVLVGIRKLEKP